MAKRSDRRDNVPGTVYLLHFDRAYGRSQHYLGWTSDLDARIEAHRHGQGARLLAVITEAGIGFELVATWDGTRNDERRRKRQKHHWRWCPVCRADRRRSC